MTDIILSETKQASFPYTALYNLGSATLGWGVALFMGTERPLVMTASWVSSLFLATILGKSIFAPSNKSGKLSVVKAWGAAALAFATGFITTSCLDKLVPADMLARNDDQMIAFAACEQDGGKVVYVGKRPVCLKNNGTYVFIPR